MTHPGGRPRIHVDADARRAASRANQAARGIKPREISLSDETMAALDALMRAAGERSRGETIARLVEEATLR